MKQARTTGYTLIEVLLATTILAVMTGMVLTITTHVLATWNQASGKLALSNEAQLALGFLSEDLEGLMIRNDGKEWVHLALEDGGGEGNFQTKGSVHLSFFAPVAPRSTLPNEPMDTEVALGAVSYRVGFRDPFANRSDGPFPRFGLYRAVMDGANTFRSGMTDTAQINIRQNIWLRSSSDGWDNLSGDGRNLSPVAWSFDRSNLLLSHVIQLTVRIHYSDTSGIRQSILIAGSDDGARSVRIYGDRILVDGVDQPVSQVHGADLELTLLTEAGARRLYRELDDIPENDSGVDWDTLVAQEGETFVRGVRFSTGRL